MGVDTNGATTFRELEAKMDVITVTGIDTQFSVVFSIDCKVAAVNAVCNGTRVSFDRHTVAELGSGKGYSYLLYGRLDDIVSICM